MANPFDEFDSQPQAQQANPFDEFDSQKGQAVPKNSTPNPFMDNRPYKGGQATFKNDNASQVLQPIKTAGSAVAGVLAPVMNAADKPRNAIAGALTGINDGNSLGQDWDNAVAGWKQQKRFSVGDIAFKNLQDARDNPNKNFVNKTISTLQKAGDFFTGDKATTDAIWSTANAVGGDIATDPTMYLGVGEGKLMAQAVRAQKLLDSGVDASKIAKPMLDALDKVKASRGLGAADKLTQADTLTKQLWNGDKNLTYFNQAIPGTGKVLAPVAGVAGKVLGGADAAIGKVMGGLKPSDVLFTDMNNPFKGYQFRDAAHTVGQAGDIEGAANFLSGHLNDNIDKTFTYMNKRYGIDRDTFNRMVMDHWEAKNPPADPLDLEQNLPTSNGGNGKVGTPTNAGLGDIAPSLVHDNNTANAMKLYPDLAPEVHANALDSVMPATEASQVPRNQANAGLSGAAQDLMTPEARLEAAMAGMNRSGSLDGIRTGDTFGLADLAPGRKAARTSADALDAAMSGRGTRTAQGVAKGTGGLGDVGHALTPEAHAAEDAANALDHAMPATKGKGGGTHEDSIYEIEPDTPNANVIHEQTNPNKAESLDSLKEGNPDHVGQATSANKLDRAMRGESVNPRGRPADAERPEVPAKPETIPVPKDEAPKDVKADEQAVAKERVQSVVQQALDNSEASRVERLRQEIKTRIEAYKASGNDKLFSVAHAIEHNILNHPEHGTHIPTLEESLKALDRRALNKGTGRKAVERSETPVDTPVSHDNGINPKAEETKPNVPKNQIDPDKAAAKIDEELNRKASTPKRKPETQAKPAEQQKPVTAKERAKAVNEAAKSKSKLDEVSPAEKARQIREAREAKSEDRAGEATGEHDADVSRAEGTKTTGDAFTKRAAAMRKAEDRRIAKELGLDADDPLFSGHDDAHSEPDPHEAYEKGASREEYEKANDTLDQAKVDEYVKQGDLDGLSKTVEEMQKMVDEIHATLKNDWSKKTTPEFDKQLRDTLADIKAKREAIEKLKAQQKACK